MVFGLISFSCYVRDDDLPTFIKLWIVAAFFTMIGAFSALLLCSIDSENEYAKLGVIFILFVACIMYIATGAYYVDKYCYDQTECSVGVFGMSSFITFLILRYDMNISMFFADYRRSRSSRIGHRCGCNRFVFIISIIFAIQEGQYCHILNDCIYDEHFDECTLLQKRPR